ncbi:hypothetical protein [Streptomyces sp. NPDC058401]|uniref:hypothetical protein n=1 Tax=Streptomyces sp. NPDC058401 TaxID=3346480 RepID=UPI00365009B5
MNHASRKPRLVLFAASAAIVAGGVLAPATALAATPATSHAVRADGDTGSDSTLLLHTGPDSLIGRDSGPESPVFRAPEHPQWQCFAAPCGPPGGAVEEVWPFHPHPRE